MREAEIIGMIRGKWGVQNLARRGVMVLHSVSEVVALIVCEKELIPVMVQNVSERKSDNNLGNGWLHYGNQEIST